MNWALFIGALITYLVSTIFSLMALPWNKEWLYRATRYTLLGAFAFHLLSVLARYYEAGYTPITNLHEALSFLALSIAGFYLFIGRIYRIDVLGSIILPVVSVLLISAATFPGQIGPIPPVLKSYWLPIHTIFAFLGHAIFFVSFVISLAYLVLERSIKKKRMPAVSRRLPSLDVLDSVNYRCMSIGFPFLTVGIISGSIWAGFAWGAYWSWDPKETLSLITWIVYAILLHNRLTIGWRGRKTAYLMILGFLFIILTFFGVNLFLGGLHSYLSL